MYVGKSLTYLSKSKDGSNVIGRWFAEKVDERSRISIPMITHNIGRSISQMIPNVSRVY